jgi:4-aminobutyrate aminotransferase-like enzyme
VQVGYGRLGSHFWAFERAGAVPDIVTLAKPAGNGHPLGAVITTRPIAEAFAEQTSFFSSAGGGPVSCAIGTAVLDVIRDEGLQANAAAVGAQVREALTALADRHAIVGAIHGDGLHLGVELVRDRDTRVPAAAETAVICERLLSAGMLVQPTGDHGNVLKVKPPLCLDVPDAERFVAALDLILAQGAI